MNYETKKIVNFDSMKDLVTQSLQDIHDDITIKIPNFFVRDKYLGRIYMRDTTKTVGFNYTKRCYDTDTVVADKYFTYPHGYRPQLYMC